MKGLKISLWVDYEDLELDITFEQLGMSESDFEKLSHQEKCKAVAAYVKNKAKQPRWNVDDFSYFNIGLQLEITS